MVWLALFEPSALRLMFPFFRSSLMPALSLLSRHRMAPSIGVALSALLCASCTNLTEANPITNRFGAVSILAKNAGGATARANATVIVFEAFSAALPSSLLQQSDQCVFSQVDTSTAPVRGVNRAGDAVGFTVGGRPLSLAYDATFNRYATPENAPFTYTAGEQLQVSIPGNGDVFPASTIGVRLAEPIIPGTITIPTGTEPMTFRWNAASDTSSAIIVSLRYANPAQNTFANEQIYCALKDDGTHQIPTSNLAAFLASPNDKRRLQITRWRTGEVRIDSRTFLHIASSIDTTLVFQP